MRLALFTGLAVLASLCAQPVLAQSRPVVLMCRLTDDSGTGWVPDFIMLTRQTTGPNAGRIEVFDPILQTLTGRPIQAQITADNSRSRTYGWALAGVRNASGQRTERLDYRLTVRKSDGSARITAEAQGYDNTMTGEGACGSPDDERVSG